LVTRVDHKGKIFSDQVQKQKVVSIVQTDSGRIRGVLFQDPDIRLKDNLNDRSEDFIAMEDVELLSPQGAVIDRCPFMAINKRHIAWVMPATSEDGECDQGPH
jgi:hypothetical protein